MKYAVQKGSHNTFWAKMYSFIEKHCFKIKSGSIIFLNKKKTPTLRRSMYGYLGNYSKKKQKIYKSH